MQPSYEDKLREHLDERPYRPETIVTVNRIVHVGHVSAQSALEIIEVLEEDRKSTDTEMRGTVWPDEAYIQPRLERTPLAQSDFESHRVDL